MLVQEAIVDAKFQAQNAIREEYAKPQDLDGVAADRRARAEELKMVETKLMEQFRTIQDGAEHSMRLVDGAVTSLETSVQRLDSVQSLIEGSQALIANFSLVREVGHVRGNLYHTLDTLDSLESVPKRIERAWELVTDPNNILALFEEIRALQRFRDEALAMSKNNSALLTLLEARFRQVENLKDAMEVQLFQLVRSCLQVGRTNGAVLVKVAVIIELNRVENARQTTPGPISTGVRGQPSSARGRGRPASAQDGPTAASYKSQAAKTMLQSIEERFKKLFVPPMKKATKVEEDLASSVGVRSAAKGPAFSMDDFTNFKEELYSDLCCVYDYVEPCFPETYRLFAFYVKNYHRQLVNVLSSFHEGTFAVGALLNTIEWVQRKYSVMVRKLGGPNMSPPLQTMLYPFVTMYVVDFITMYNGYLTNLKTVDLKDLEEVGNSIDEDEVMYVTKVPMHLFSLFNQALSVIRSRGLPILILSVVDTVTEFLDDWLVHSKRKLLDLESPDILIKLTLDLLMAQLNNAFKYADYCDQYFADVKRGLLASLPYDSDPKIDCHPLLAGLVETARARGETDESASASNLAASLDPPETPRPRPAAERAAGGEDSTSATNTAASTLDQAVQEVLRLSQEDQPLYEHPVYAPWVRAAERKMRSIADGFRRLADMAVVSLGNRMFLDIDPELEKLLEPGWEVEGLASVLATLQDYIDKDFRSHVPEVQFSAVAASSLERIVQRYCQKLFTQPLRFHVSMINRFRQDLKQIRDVFGAWVPTEALDSQLRPLAALFELVDLEQSKLAHFFSVLIKDIPDISADMVDLVLSGRVDLNPTDVDSLVQTFEEILSVQRPPKPASNAQSSSLARTVTSVPPQKLSFWSVLGFV